MEATKNTVVCGLGLALVLGCGGGGSEDNVGELGRDRDAGADAGSDASATPAVDAAIDASSIDAGGDAGDPSSDAAAPLPEFTFKPSNFALTQLPALPTAGILRITSSCTFDSEQGRLSCSGGARHEGEFSFSTIDGEQGVRLGVLRARGLQIDMAGELLVRGKLPLVIVANDSIDVFGRISAASVAITHYAGGAPSASPNKANGNGLGGGQLGTVGQFVPSGGGSYCGVGGKGALTVGTTGAVGNGGATYGDPKLVPLLGGSSGGGSYGGAGGGAVQIVSAKQVTVGATGRIDAGGGGADNNASGGGSGGAILIEAPQVSNGGLLAVNGGGGSAARGGSGGQDGQASELPAAGETAAAGTDLDGAGSAGANIHGEDGKSTGTTDSLGGGGGAGRIRINTQSGTGGLAGKLSPDATTPCTTEGPLTPSSGS
jgi:hypothetical protein